MENESNTASRMEGDKKPYPTPKEVAPGLKEDSTTASRLESETDSSSRLEVETVSSPRMEGGNCVSLSSETCDHNTIIK